MERTLTAFVGDMRVAAGDEQETRAALLALGDSAQSALLFDDATGRQVDIDLRGPPEEPRGRGRPKLGVQAREVTLLPRHWDWLADQPGGASVTLRKLVEAARKASTRPSPRAAMDAAYHFLTVMAGDRPGYEAAMRALYAKDRGEFESAVSQWPTAIREHGMALAEPAFAG